MPRKILSLVLLGLTLAACGRSGGAQEAQTAAQAASAADAALRTDTVRLLAAQVSKVARLYTAEYRLHKIVTHADAPRLKGSILSLPVDLALAAGEKKIAIPIDVTVKAYIDFAGFDAGSLSRHADGITLTLPDPQIVVTASKIDNGQVRQYVDLLRSHFSDAEMLDFARQGRDSIVSHLDRAAILATARDGAARILRPLLHRAGFAPSQVTIAFREELTPEAIPLILED